MSCSTTVGAKSSAQRQRPHIPSTQAQAVAEISSWKRRLMDACQAYEHARRELELARGELALCEATAKGEFLETEEARDKFAVGPRGLSRVA
jgi:hypothetical protein